MMTVHKTELIRVLRRAGFAEAADELRSLLPDLVDLDRDGDLLARFGITRDALISHMGGSP